IPAKWLIALEKEIPPSGEEQARGMLLLQAERLAVAESGDMVFDYSGKPDPKLPNKVLLVGCLRQRLDQIEAIFDAAGISVQAITSSALTLARGVSNTDDDVPMLVLARQGAEMVWRHEGTPKLLRHVSVIAMNGHGPVTVAPLGSELNRTLALTRANGSPVAKEVLLWDGIGLSAQQLAELSERSGVRLRPSDPISMLGIEAPAAPPEEGSPETFAPALSLAVAATDRQLLPVDFKKSRLTPRRARKVSRNTVYAFAAALAVVLGTVAVYVNVQLKQREFDRLQAQLTAEDAQIKTARTLVDRVRYAQAYFDSRPPVLECLREITLSLREEDRLWATSLTLRDDERRADNKAVIGRKGTLQGKAADSGTVLTVLDR